MELNSILWTLEKDLGTFIDWWESISYTARGGGALSIAILMIWSATRSSMEGERDSRFFMVGMVALGLLAYAAVLFSNGDTTIH